MIKQKLLHILFGSKEEQTSITLRQYTLQLEEQILKLERMLRAHKAPPFIEAQIDYLKNEVELLSHKLKLVRSYAFEAKSHIDEYYDQVSADTVIHPSIVSAAQILHHIYERQMNDEAKTL